MESFLKDIDGVLRDIIEAEKQGEDLILDFDSNVQRILLKYVPTNGKDTPIKPSKKKIKARLERCDSQDTDDISNNSISPNGSSIASSRNITSTTNSTTTNIVNENESLLRPVRTARAKAIGYKEPALNTKMRNTKTTTTIKVERISTIGNSGRAPITVKDILSPPIVSTSNKPALKVKSEKLSILEKITTTSVSTISNNNSNNSIPNNNQTKRTSSDEGISSIGDRDDNTSKKSNDSIEIVPMEVNKTIELSDEENDNNDEQSKMPPPSFVPPAVKVKEKKQSSTKSSTSTIDINTEPMPSVRSTRSKQPRARMIKQEPVELSDSESTAANHSESGNESSERSVASTVKPTKSKKTVKSKPGRALNTTGESLYEDAVSDQSNKMFNSYVRIQKNNVEAPSSSQQSNDATYVSANGESEPLSPRGTYVIPHDKNAEQKEVAPCNDTFLVPPIENTEKAKCQPINDQNVVISTNTGAKQKKKNSVASSIMTEDDSDSTQSSIVNEHEAVEKPTKNGMLTKKNPKELFNPCVQKTLKQKVEAFEKLGSPVPQRETRTRTRQLTTDSDKFLKPSNPLISKVLSSVALEQQNKHLRTNSATRYVQASSKYPSASSLTKSQSVEEIRRKNQAVADEKKKKRDEKLRQAQQQREAQEREKAEKYKKMFLEKEQRMKETQQKKQQEELQKHQEQKRREAEREQIRKEMKAAADRKERDNLKILAEQKVLQEKLKANKRAAELEQQKQKNLYTFDMIESGDSTDDEGKETTKRPPPPTWSVMRYRIPYVVAQANIKSNVIDSFLSIERREVDLREVFPKIDEKHLRRNSSAVWTTPPRYSTMPKY